MQLGNMLIIEDELYIRDSLAEFFQDEGYEVSVAESGEEALVLLEHRSFDIFIVDIRLSGMDGAKTIRLIKGIDADANILIFTGSLEFEITPDLADFGLTQNHVIYKPVSDLAIIAERIAALRSE